MRKPRILLAWTETAGYYAALQAGLAAHGIDAVQVDADNHPFAYRRSGPRRMPFVMLERTVRLWRSWPRPWRLVLLPWLAVLYVLVLTATICSFDAVVLASGRPLSGCFLENWLLFLTRKRVISVFHGTDSRPPWCSGHFLREGDGPDSKRLVRESRRRQRRVQVAEAFSDAVVQLPQTDHFHHRRYLSYLEMGVPSAGEDLPPPTPTADASAEATRALRVLHCPSRPELKGSALLTAIARDPGAGIEVDLRLITGRPHHEVQQALQDCDLVLDQAWADTPMATFATEGAWAGKPVLVGGHAEEWLAATPGTIAGRSLPVRYCRPEDLRREFRRLTTDGDARHALGANARRFVRALWTRHAIAGRYLRVLDRKPDATWWRRPGCQPHPAGCGVDRPTVGDAVRMVVQAHGVAGLATRRADVWRSVLALLRESRVRRDDSGGQPRNDR